MLDILVFFWSRFVVIDLFICFCCNNCIHGLSEKQHAWLIEGISSSDWMKQNKTNKQTNNVRHYMSVPTATIPSIIFLSSYLLSLHHSSSPILFRACLAVSHKFISRGCLVQASRACSNRWCYQNQEDALPVGKSASPFLIIKYAKKSISYTYFSVHHPIAAGAAKAIWCAKRFGNPYSLIGSPLYCLRTSTYPPSTGHSIFPNIIVINTV